MPIVIWTHPPATQIFHDFVVPQIPPNAEPKDVTLLIIGIVGATVTPWQLFFQQSYIVDKRITARFIHYERADLWIGIVLVTIGAAAMICLTAAVFVGRPEFGNFEDAGAVAAGLGKYIGPLAGIGFALALIGASAVGAGAVSLSTAYAIGDVLSLSHSLHRKPAEARLFYAVYCGLVILAAILVLMPGTPLGLLTTAVQSLAGVLLPSATVFLLLLCNDEAVLGPWVNSPRQNLFTGAVVAILVMLSLIMTASIFYPGLDANTIIIILTAAIVCGGIFAVWFSITHRHPGAASPKRSRTEWRMPPLAQLPPAPMGALTRIWIVLLRLYLFVAGGLVLAHIVQLVTSSRI